MATTRIFPLHTGKGRSVATALRDVTDYMENPLKTEDGELVSSYECVAETAVAEFLLSKTQYHSLTGRNQGKHDVIAYHARQSFKPGEITPAMVYRTPNMATASAQNISGNSAIRFRPVEVMRLVTCPSTGEWFSTVSEGSESIASTCSAVSVPSAKPFCSRRIACKVVFAMYAIVCEVMIGLLVFASHCILIPVPIDVCQRQQKKSWPVDMGEGGSSSALCRTFSPWIECSAHRGAWQATKRP